VRNSNSATATVTATATIIAAIDAATITTTTNECHFASGSRALLSAEFFSKCCTRPLFQQFFVPLVATKCSGCKKHFAPPGFLSPSIQTVLNVQSADRWSASQETSRNVTAVFTTARHLFLFSTT